MNLNSRLSAASVEGLPEEYRRRAVPLQGKKPLHRGWNVREYMMEDWWQLAGSMEDLGVGLRLGEGLGAIDYDKAEDREEARRLGVPPSPQVTITLRGAHEYFRSALDRSFKWRNSDIKASGQCVIAPTWRADVEHRYRWENGIVPIAELPELPVELLKVEEVRTEVRQALAVALPDDRARRYIDRIDPAIQGRNGSAAVLRALQKILNLANGDLQTAWGYALYYNRSKCEPPFDEEATEGPDSLSRKLHEALRVWRPSS